MDYTINIGKPDNLTQELTNSEETTGLEIFLIIELDFILTYF